MIVPGTALAVLLITGLCTCQSISAIVRTYTTSSAPVPISSSTAEQTATSTNQPTPSVQEAPPISFAVPNLGCGECYINAATSSISSQATTDIILTAFSITSAYTSDGYCITTSGLPTMLKEAYTVTSPATIPSSAFQAYLISEFIDYLGLTCIGLGEELDPTPLEPFPNITVMAVTSASLSASANSTTSQPLHSSNATKSSVTPLLDEPSKIGIGVGASAAALILISLAALIWRKRRFRSAAITAKNQGKTENRREGTSASEGENQPYLQQKAELEAEERRKYELEARQKIHELDGGTEIREIPAGTHEHRLAVMRSRQELRGGEHSQELDA